MVRPRYHVCRWLSLALFAAALSGCSRSHYRERADRDAQCLIAAKADGEIWDLPDFTIYPDRRSRFFDPFDPDHPPMPPDDVASHELMHCIYGMKHSKRWHQDGDLDDVENPHWREMLPSYTRFSQDGKLLLDLPTASALARLHSRDYQSNLEEIYLAALDVAFERFRFDVQFFGGLSTGGRTRGNLPAASLGAAEPGNPGSSSVADVQTGVEASNRFAAGGELLVGFANSFVWQFAGPDTNFSTSLINFNLVQPLLRQGGRQVVLERLTRAERSLLAALRAQAQFRQEFFRNVAVGEGTETEPRRIGGFLGGAGLSGFTGTGGGGFGGIGATTGFGGFGARGADVGGTGAGGGAGLAGGGEGRVGGFYGLVQQYQAIRNTEASLNAQLDMLDLLELHFRGKLIKLIQVDEFRQNILTERAALLRNQVGFHDAVEFYVSNTLGLPPSLAVEIEDSLIAPFQLQDATLLEQQAQVTQLRKRLGEFAAEPTAILLKPIVADLERVFTAIASQFDMIRQEHAALVAGKADQIRSLDSEQDRRDYENEVQAVIRDLDNLRNRFAGNTALLKRIAARMATEPPGVVRDALVNLVRKASNEIQELSLIQSRIRVKRVVIPPFDLEENAALLIARENRLDWMNRRASLVDQWRLIALNANSLKGVLDVSIDGDLGTNGDNPVRFRGATGGLRARLEFDAPLNRKAERNLYREAIINYQQSKRGYIAFVDRVELSIRSRLRLLRRLQTNFEIQRRALEIAIRRVDQTREDLDAPFAVTEPGKAPPQLEPTLAQNLLRALSDLRNTQDNFLSVWTNYEATRMNLLIDLGLLQVDENGTWIDRPLDQARSMIQAHELQKLSATEASENPLAALDLPDSDQMLARGGPEYATTPTGSPKAVTPLAPPAGAMPKFGKNDFVRHLREIRHLHDEGKDAATISRETGLSEPVVHAYIRSLESGRVPSLNSQP